MRSHSGRVHQAATRTLGEPDDSVVSLLLALDRRLTAIEQAVGEVRDVLQHQALDKEWYTTTELAEALGVTQLTVQERYCNAGRIECEKDPNSNKWRIPVAEYQRRVGGGGLRPSRK